MTLVTEPSGSRAARITIIAARPGKHEVGLCECPRAHPVGIPLVGPSGNLLWKLLAGHGISRSDCYATNVRRDYNAEHSVPTSSEIHEVLSSLRDELDSIESNIIIVLGREALYATCGKSSIEQWRGSVIPSTLVPGRKALATWHPAAIFRRPEWAYVLDADLRRAVYQSSFPDIRRPEREFLLDPPPEIAIPRLRELGQCVSVDIETFGRRIACVALSDSPGFAVCIPFIGGQNSPRDKVHILRELDWTLHTKMLIGQNFGMFDQKILLDHGFRVGYIKMDTMLAHHLLYPELGMKSSDASSITEKFAGSHDLAFLCSMYSEEPYYKYMSGEWKLRNPPDWEMFWTYNCLDAAVTYEVYEALASELEEFHQENYHRSMVRGLIGPVLRMQERGLLVDKSALAAVRERTNLEAKYLQLLLDHKVGFACNVRSTIDLRYLIHEVLHMRSTKRTPKGLPSTDKDTLLQLAYGSSHADTFRLVLDIRERRTLASGFFHLETSSDDRYRASYKIHGTDSGRLSSVGPGATEAGRGPQLQNIPVKARSVFVAAPGSVLVCSDLRRAEAMFVAYDACDRELINCFADPKRDLYKEEAAYALSIPEGEVTKWQRDIFKQVVHATHYGMHGPRLVTHLRMKGVYIEDLLIRGIQSSSTKGEYLIQSYMHRHQAIAEWQDAIWREGKAHRVLHDGLGRRRFFMGRMDEHLRRVMLSFRPQATVVGITNRALILLDRQGWNVVLQVHDSLAIECSEAQLVACASALEDALRCPIELHGRTLVIPTDTKFGKSWGRLDGIVAPNVLALHRESRGSRDLPPLDRHDDDKCDAREEGILR